MRIVAQAFWRPKAGNIADEYEDAAWPCRDLRGHFLAFSAAVADGATETSFSGLWAKLLVQAYCRGYIQRHGFLESLPAIQERWRRRVSGKSLPWYAEQKLESGAFAALVGLTLNEGHHGNGDWHALAVGDSCLFQVSGGKLRARFPLAEPEQFDSRPILVPSNAVSAVAPDMRTATGKWQRGDTFYLMSDAIACWYLTNWKGSDPFDSIEETREFNDFVESQQADATDGAPALKNDDVTLVRISIMG